VEDPDAYADLLLTDAEAEAEADGASGVWARTIGLYHFLSSLSQSRKRYRYLPGFRKLNLLFGRYANVAQSGLLPPLGKS
jgi:hypothetical protein